MFHPLQAAGSSQLRRSWFLRLSDDWLCAARAGASRVSRARPDSPAALATPIFLPDPLSAAASSCSAIRRGGPFRTTPFSSEGGRARLRRVRQAARAAWKASPPRLLPRPKVWVPPISMMAIVGNTHTQVPSMPAPTDPYQPNDNTVLSPLACFGAERSPAISARSSKSPILARPLVRFDRQPGRPVSTTTGRGTMPTCVMRTPQI